MLFLQFPRDFERAGGSHVGRHNAGGRKGLGTPFKGVFAEHLHFRAGSQRGTFGAQEYVAVI